MLIGTAILALLGTAISALGLILGFGAKLLLEFFKVGVEVEAD